jgi:hypothetical protein
MSEDIKKFKKRVNFYGAKELFCPFCEEWHFAHNIKTHIALKASWEKRKGLKGKHLKFWMENTEIVRIRQWKK